MTPDGSQVRDIARERAFLQSAARGADSVRFVAHAEGRLAAGELKFGDSWTRLRLEEFVRELTEEAADLGAWAALAAQALTALVPVQVVSASQLLHDLCAVAHAGALAHSALERMDAHIGGTPA